MSAAGAASRPPPGRAWYVVGTALVVASVAGAAAAAVLDLRGVDALPEPFTAPGSHTTTVEAGPRQAIWLQTRGSPQGGVFEGRVRAGDLDCSVTGPDGAALPLRVSEGTTVSWRDAEFVSRLAFTPERDGLHEVACTTDVDGPVPLGVGPLFAVPRWFGRLALIGLAGWSGIMLGGIVLLVVALRRWRHRRAGPEA